MRYQPVSITKKAAEELKKLGTQKGLADVSLRFADVQAACDSFEYTLNFSERNTEDLVFPSHGIPIYVPIESISRLGGARIDFDNTVDHEHLDGLLKLGFTIANPNEKGPCSCACNKGHSF